LDQSAKNGFAWFMVSVGKDFIVSSLELKDMSQIKPLYNVVAND
jgi:hypothetical protein